MFKSKCKYHCRITLTWKAKAVIYWEFSVNIISRDSLNYKVYPYIADYRMKDFIFFCLVETENSAKLNLNSCKFKVKYFYNKVWRPSLTFLS